MRIFMVANPKGGAGKSTLATNLAGYLAQDGWQGGSSRVMLGDVDRQQSARAWLSIRPTSVAPIRSWELSAGEPARPPKGTTHAVIDTPAGLHGERLKNLLKMADAVLVPLQPSLFDILATRAFLDDLAELKAARGTMVGLVGMRVDSRTRAAEQLLRFTETLSLPLLGTLRDTQNYVQLAAHGLTLFDLAPSKVEKDRVQWEPIERWAAMLG